MNINILLKNTNKKNGAIKLERLSLLRDLYRSLIATGRTYAAFERETIEPLIERLASRKEIFDPMSGYGGLMSYCSETGIKTYGLEINPPLYLWQVLIHPKHTEMLISIIDKLLALQKKWPKTSTRALVSNEWFPEESKYLVVKLLKLTFQILERNAVKKNRAEEISLALLLPFVGRFACCVPGDISTHVKQGGICVLSDWQEDYKAYLYALRERLKIIRQTTKEKHHTIKLSDCRTVSLPKNYFSALISSPPYPNHRDYSTMFAPENDCLSWLKKINVIKFRISKYQGIGSNFVSEKEKNPIVKNKPANDFLKALREYKGSKRAQYDNYIYYIPYFSNYFADLEKAYENIVTFLKRDFEGYIVVVNNTARDQVIPVAESIMAMWKNMGFNTEIFSKYETFHVGTKNPRARGLKSKHTEYIIRIWRQ